MTGNEIYTLYENGKGRRYALLFSVNTVAWAIFSFSKKAVSFQLSLILVSLSMIVFTIIMYIDIKAFGEYMAELGRPEGLKLFGPKGRHVLRGVCVLIAVMWAVSVYLGWTGQMVPPKA